MAEQFCLKWNNYQLSLTSAFKHILEEEDFVDLTLSAEGQSLKGHKVVLSACSSYFKDLLRGISLWQHPVLVLKDVPFNDLQSILEFIYLGEVNLEQERLESFLKTAEVLQIKGLTDGIKDPGGSIKAKMESDSSDISDTSAVKFPTAQLTKRTAVQAEAVSQSAEKRGKFFDNDDYENMVEYDNMVIDYGSDADESSTYSGEHIIVAGDPVTVKDLNQQPPPAPGVKEDLGPLHKRCPVCHMIMLKKNLSRHVRDQHTAERPRSVCPICQKTYKTADWLKDHIRRGHGYTKEDTDDLMSKIKLDNNMNLGDNTVPQIKQETILPAIAFTQSLKSSP